MAKLAHFFALVAALLAAAAVAGCSLAGRLAVKATEGVGSVTEKTTVAVIKTSGRVTASTAKALVTTSGSVTKDVTTSAFVTFKDTAGGVSRQVPYQEGLRLYAASQSAKLGAGLAAFELVREGAPRVVAKWSSVKPGTANDPVLKRGDVIRVSRLRQLALAGNKRS